MEAEWPLADLGNLIIRIREAGHGSAFCYWGRKNFGLVLFQCGTDGLLAGANFTQALKASKYICNRASVKIFCFLINF